VKHACIRSNLTHLYYICLYVCESNLMFSLYLIPRYTPSKMTWNLYPHVAQSPRPQVNSRCHCPGVEGRKYSLQTLKRYRILRISPRTCGRVYGVCDEMICVAKRHHRVFVQQVDSIFHACRLKNDVVGAIRRTWNLLLSQISMFKWLQCNFHTRILPSCG
jgi:hypothetical protein